MPSSDTATSFTCLVKPKSVIEATRNFAVIIILLLSCRSLLRGEPQDEACAELLLREQTRNSIARRKSVGRDLDDSARLNLRERQCHILSEPHLDGAIFTLRPSERESIRQCGHQHFTRCRREAVEGDLRARIERARDRIQHFSRQYRHSSTPLKLII